MFKYLAFIGALLALSGCKDDKSAIPVECPAPLARGHYDVYYDHAPSLAPCGSAHTWGPFEEGSIVPHGCFATEPEEVTECGSSVTYLCDLGPAMVQVDASLLWTNTGAEGPAEIMWFYNNGDTCTGSYDISIIWESEW